MTSKRSIRTMIALSIILSTLGCGSLGAIQPATFAQYCITYPINSVERVDRAAHEIHKALFREYGELPLLSLTGDSRQDRVIDVSVVNDRMFPMDWSIEATSNHIAIQGGSSFAVAAAVQEFLSAIDSGEILAGQKYEKYYCFDPSWINPLCHDASGFVPVWAPLYTVPQWMRDPYECLYALTHDVERIVAIAHRGDFVNYPEGSIENLLSSIMAGADAIELDFRLTKDNIPVLMHDESLRRTTDFAKKAGKQSLPTSEFVGDWTLEQLRELNLVRNDGAFTQYKIPTLYEAFLLAKHGVQFTLDDKADETIHPVFAATGSTTSLQEILPVAIATDSLHSLLFYYGYWHGNTDMEFWETIEGTSETYKEVFSFWKNCLQTGNIQKPFLCWDDSRYKNWKFEANNESAYFWKLWESEGKQVMWTNDIVKLCRYIAKNYQGSVYEIPIN